MPYLVAMVRLASLHSLCVLFVAVLLFVSPTLADQKTEKYVTTSINGQTVLVPDNRRPALYTGDFGDCMGSSTVNVTRFDAAYYKDNMTVTFHLEGNTAVKNESLMSEYRSYLEF